MASALNSVLDNDDGVNSIDISATTNGSHNPNSAHYTGNAVDINIINDVHVGTSGTGFDNAQALENAAMSDPNVSYVEGPAGNFIRSSPTADWTAASRESGDTTHVHISVFK